MWQTKVIEKPIKVISKENKAEFKLVKEIESRMLKFKKSLEKEMNVEKLKGVQFYVSSDNKCKIIFETFDD
ncbi:MAG: hypothetical protein LBH98_10095 [Chitinispirillales bacterium]|jgi:hypothetical protein|nr:hypothetical protein [Chitinispirillales bacterium]